MDVSKIPNSMTAPPASQRSSHQLAAGERCVQAGPNRSLQKGSLLDDRRNRLTFATWRSSHQKPLTFASSTPYARATPAPGSSVEPRASANDSASVKKMSTVRQNGPAFFAAPSLLPPLVHGVRPRDHVRIRGEERRDPPRPG